MLVHILGNNGASVHESCNRYRIFVFSFSNFRLLYSTYIFRQEFNTNQKTSPFIYEGCDIENQKMVGGYTDFAKKVKETYKMSVPLD